MDENEVVNEYQQNPDSDLDEEVQTKAIEDGDKDCDEEFRIYDAKFDYYGFSDYSHDEDYYFIL